MKKKHYGEYYTLSHLFPKKLLLTMKLTILLTCILAVKVSASVYSQNERINMEIKDKTVRETLKSIEKQSHFRFFYNDDFIDLDKKLNVTLENKSIDDVLAIVFDKSAVTFKVLDNNFIVITPVELQQQQKVSGVVTDAGTGEPLIGVTVIVEGTKLGTITDAKGKYTLDIPSTNAVIIFSYLGYLTQQIAVAGQSNIDVKMESDVKKLDEVVVIGYGSVKKSDLSGSVGVIKASKLDQQTNSNLAAAMQGKVSGVSIQSAGGAPGVGMKIQIHGTGSVNNN
ncbi:MAG TPA: carboxypeptidase-like regulatory domain-containing protein, partial [Bacteroidales bacterium]